MSVVHLSGGGRSSGCAAAAPVPTLSPQLAALGGFDQPYDASNVQALDALATQAAGVVAHNLIGVTPATPVAVAAVDTAKPDALVIPLLYPPTSSNAGRVAGLVVFLRDCAGRAYYSTILDLTAQTRPPQSFPAVTEQAAAAVLHTMTPVLVYLGTPAVPLWRDPSTGVEIPAGPLYPS